MSARRRSRSIVWGAIVAGVVLVVAVLGLGVVGIPRTVTAGTQPTVCGTRIGVVVDDGGVRLLGASDATHRVGDRVRLNPLCVVQITAVTARSADDPRKVGAGADVLLRWRLW